MTVKLASHADFGVEVCKALGLEPSTVRHLTIECDVADGGIVHVEIEGFAPADAVEGITGEVSKYYLVAAESIAS